MTENPKIRATTSLLIAIFCILAIGIGLIGYTYHVRQKAHTEMHAFDELSAIADLKVYELSAWRKERLGDGAVIAKNPMIADEVKRWLSDPDSTDVRQQILTWMDSFKATYNYKQTLLVDLGGTIRLPSSQTGKVDSGIVESLPEVVRVKAPLLNDFYRSEEDGAVRMDLIAPILDYESQDRPVIAVLVLRIDPRDFIFPFIQKWPTPSKTSETLLVRRDGDKVVFLNELRHRNDAPLELKLPLSGSEDLPAAMAVQGREGVVEGIDYRGVPVLAALRTIPDSLWAVVAKVDKEEVFAPIYESARLIALMAGIMTALAAVGLGFVSSRQRAQVYRKQKEVLERARDELDLKVRERTDELVKANAALQEKAALLELAHDAILVRDLDGRIIYWSRGAEEVYGLKKAETEGKVTYEILGTVFPMPLEEIKSIIADRGEWQGELLHSRHDGTQIVVESRWALQRDANGNPAAVLEINRDVTARKMAEISLKGYARKLEESNRMLQDFAFIASHDLQEPLRKIHAFGERLRTRYGESLGEEGLDYLQRMNSAADRMQGLLQSLLVYSRVTTKAKPFVAVDLAQIVQEVIADLEVVIHETQGSVEVGGLPRLEADPSQMRQLFQNLIGNALKFHGDDKPVVRVYGKPCWNGACEIIVEDNGIGFDEKYLEKIFDPFERLHGKSSPYKGSGMGLAICRKIVDRHNGAITARSEPGTGSTFIVTLPLKQCC